jgi:hypothetical protein
MGVRVRVVGIRLGLQIRKPHDNHGNTNGGIPAMPFLWRFYLKLFIANGVKRVNIFSNER